MVSELRARKELEMGPRTDESSIDFEVKQVVDGLWARVVLEEGESRRLGSWQVGEPQGRRRGRGKAEEGLPCYHVPGEM